MKPKFMLAICLTVLLSGQAFAQEASGEEVEEDLSAVDKVNNEETETPNLDVQVDEDAVEVIDDDTDQSDTEQTVGVEPTKSTSDTKISRSGKYLSYDDYNFNFNEHQEVEIDNNYNYGKFFNSFFTLW